MTYPKNILIQTALRPMAVFIQNSDNSESLELAEDFEALFEILSEIELNLEANWYINVGPGSYSGIRTGVSYILGLLHASGIEETQIKPYTTFDLIGAQIESKENPIYIKSWPRLPNNKLSGTKGYFSNGNEIAHVQFEEIEATLDLMIFTEEESIDDKDAVVSNSTHITSKDLDSDIMYRNLIDSKLPKRDLEPLYINPVNITPKKKK